MGWVYFRTKSIWPCIWIHFINNGIVFSMALLSGSVDIAEANVEGPGPWSMLAVVPVGVIMLYGVILLLDQNLPNRPIWIQSSEEE